MARPDEKVVMTRREAMDTDGASPADGTPPGLVRAAMAGDADALRTLWQDNRRWIAAVMLAAKPREADLEDLLQDVALTMVRQVHTIDDERALRGWLRQVALNTARAAGRTTTRRKGLDRERRHELARGPAGSGDAQVAQRDEADRLMQLASELPEAYRECVMLRCVRGMSYRAIASITGLAETTVETRIARGRRMLREIAQQQGKPQHSGQKQQVHA